MNSDLLNKLINYVNNNRVNYAVLIDGEWGSGKTYFIKEQFIPTLLNNKEENSKKPIYISLYGVETLDSISAEIYLQITGKFSKVASLGFSVAKIIKPDINYSEIFGVLNDKFNLKDYVLIFDDLERANIDVNSCLAYINSFVEHQEIKVIIIANEKEIGKKDYNTNYELKVLSAMNDKINYNDPEKKDILGKAINSEVTDINTVMERIDRIYEMNYKYRLIKEKLIGKTYKYIPSFEFVIDRLIEMYKDEMDYYKFLKENKKVLISKLNLYKCNNLRTIKCIFEDFMNLYNIIDKIDFDKNNRKDIITKIYVNFIIVIINIKNGNKMLEWTGESNYQTTCFGDDIHQSYYMYFLSFKFVDDYILDKKINEDFIKDALNEYCNNNENDYENIDNAYSRLKCYWELEDEEISKYMNELKNELSNNYYPCSFYPKIIVTLSYIENLNYEINLINEMIEIMEKNMDEQVGYRYHMDYDQILRDEKVLKIYNKNIERLKIASKNKSIVLNAESVNTILDNESWGIELYNYIHKSENYNYFFNEKAFLSKLDIQKILDKLKTSNSKNVYHFKYCIDRMYSFGNLKEHYGSDKEAIEILINGISKFDYNIFGITKKEAMSYLMEVLKQKNQLL